MSRNEESQSTIVSEMSPVTFDTFVIPTVTETFEVQEAVLNYDLVGHNLSRVFSDTHHIYNQIDAHSDTETPPKLERQTNTSHLEFGERPDYYAFITDESEVNRMLESKSFEVKKCVHREQIADPAVHHCFGDLKSKVTRYIVRATEQLNQLQLAGLVTFTKAGNKRTVRILETGDTVTISFFLCDLTGYIFTLISINVWYRTNPRTPSLESPPTRALVYVLNDILQDKKKFFHTTMRLPPLPVPPIGNRNLFRTFMTPVQHVGVFEHAKDIPDWVDDEDSSWNFPETEPFEEPGIVFPSDILEKLSLVLPEDAPVTPNAEDTPLTTPTTPPKLTREESSHYYGHQDEKPTLQRQSAVSAFSHMSKKDFQEMHRKNDEFYEARQNSRLSSEAFVVYEDEEPPHKKQRTA